MPEIHDGFQWTTFIARTSTVCIAIQQITEELGLAKSLPVPGGGQLEYIIEEVWSDDASESRQVFALNLTLLLIRFQRII